MQIQVIKIKFLSNDLLRSYKCNSYHHWSEDFDKDMRLKAVNLKGKCNCHLAQISKTRQHALHP